MDWSQVAAWVGAVAAAGSAVAAGAALKSARASERSARTLTRIEWVRRRDELTPQFRFVFAPLNPGSDVMRLSMELEGPVSLEHLVGLTVSIRDDRLGRDRVPLSYAADAMSRDQIRNTVWGPYRFAPSVGPNPSDRADVHGRRVDVTEPLLVGESLRFELHPTRPPWPTVTDAAGSVADWARMVGPHLRLSISARGTDGNRWVLPYEFLPESDAGPHPYGASAPAS